LRGLDDAYQARRIGHVAVVQDQAAVLVVRVLVQVIDALGVDERGAPLDAMHHVALGEQELGEIGAVLAGDPGDERDLARRHARSLPVQILRAAGSQSARAGKATSTATRTKSASRNGSVPR